MNTHLKQIALALAFVLFSAATSKAQQCSECDCYHIPISTRCEGCCGIAAGEVSNITSSSVAITGKVLGTEDTPPKRTFVITPKTKRNGELKEGAPVTVYYKRQGNVAERVDLVEALSGLLTPAGRPDPPLPTGCTMSGPIPPNAIRVYLGTSAGISTFDDVSVITVMKNDLLDLRRTRNGLAIGAKTFSADGKVVAEIVDNRFYVNPNNFFRMDRPDGHSLAVYDLKGVKVLDVTYINTHSVRVLGTFLLPGSIPVTVSETEILLGSNRITDFCGSGRILFSVE